MNLLDLFSGIGGFSLGLERAGFKTVAFCEIEPYPRKVLAKHWPGVPVYDDVRMLTADRLRRDGIEIDAICGGFPCQDVSCAGKGAGLDGQRSGLWSEYARLIGELQPRFALVENVPSLRSRGLGRVLGDLAALGYDAEWHCIPASAVGAPHQRDRIWIISYPSIPRELQSQRCEKKQRGWPSNNDDQEVSNPGLQGVERQWPLAIRVSAELANPGVGSWWATEPDVVRMVYGLPARVDRIKGLGNAVVPQIVEILGLAAMDIVYNLAPVLREDRD
jgi:DNA (cytosine-5)-methyltransferase 1